MNFSLFVRNYRSVFIQSRISPISRSAILLTLGLGAIGVITSIATKFAITALPNMFLLVVAVVVVDILSQLAPQTRIVEAVRIVIFGILYLVTTILCGVIAAYSMQRFAFPLQDQHLTSADMALGLNWSDYAHWVDRHPVIQSILHSAYDTTMGQTVLPLVVFAFSNRLSEVRAYLLAFAIAFTITIVVSALMPAAGPIAFVDRAAFNLLQFTGATPLDHLMLLREAGPLVLNDVPGGIATFPSFHATIAVLTPLTLRSYPRLFAALLILDAAMLAGSVSEGAHYFSDILAGSCVAVFAYVLARRIIRIEDRSVHRTSARCSPVLSYE